MRRHTWSTWDSVTQVFGTDNMGVLGTHLQHLQFELLQGEVMNATLRTTEGKCHCAYCKYSSAQPRWRRR